MNSSRLDSQFYEEVFTNDSSAQSAAEKLAAVSLSDDTTVQGCVLPLWRVIITSAYDLPEHQDKLVEILVLLSQLPDTETGQGNLKPLNKHQSLVWKDLPMLGYEFHEDWNTRSIINIPSDPPDSRRKKAIADSINRNRFVALLMATEEPVFNYSWFALVTFRDALETPLLHMYSEHPLDACIPAAAAWIEILGVEMYKWDEEFEHRPGISAPGRGGMLWKGKHGFCRERWMLWRSRFGQLATMERELSKDVRRVALEAELMMEEIENGDVG